MTGSETRDKKKSGTTHRSKKPRQQGMPDAVTPDSPSAPKGDSPSPAPKQ
jgi:hypothetical protein